MKEKTHIQQLKAKGFNLVNFKTFLENNKENHFTGMNKHACPIAQFIKSLNVWPDKYVEVYYNYIGIVSKLLHISWISEPLPKWAATISSFLSDYDNYVGLLHKEDCIFTGEELLNILRFTKTSVKFIIGEIV